MYCLNDCTNYDVKNLFEFIDCKLAFAIGEYSFYLTPKGKFIVKGEPYDFEWKDTKNRVISDKELMTLDLLHKQYQAISKYSFDPSDEESKETIMMTYELTGINCLRYLSNLKTTSEWLNMQDSQGMQLGAVFAGYVSSKIENKEERKYLLEMHDSLNYYIETIDRIALGNEKEKDNKVLTYKK